MATFATGSQEDEVSPGRTVSAVQLTPKRQDTEGTVNERHVIGIFKQ